MRKLSIVGLSVAFGLSGVAYAKEEKKAAEPKKEAKKAEPKKEEKKEEAAGGGDQAPKPPAELDQLKPFIGKFKCDMKSLSDPKHDFKATIQSKLDVDKFWVTMRYAEKKAKNHPMPFATTEVWGYDSAAKKYLMVFFHNMDGWGRLAATAWEGNSLAFTGDFFMGGKKYELRQTLTKLDKKGFGVKSEMRPPKGKWEVSMEGTCK